MRRVEGLTRVRGLVKRKEKKTSWDISIWKKKV